MDAENTYRPLPSPIAMETVLLKRYTWQYKASPLLNTIRREAEFAPVLLRILFYVTLKTVVS